MLEINSIEKKSLQKVSRMKKSARLLLKRFICGDSLQKSVKNKKKL